MPPTGVRYILDEHLGGALASAIRKHNLSSGWPFDVVRVGGPAGPAYGTKDPALLEWAEGAGRIPVTQDKRTMPGHFRTHLAQGRACPGVFLLRDRYVVTAVVEFLATAAYASEPAEWHGQLYVVG